VAGAFAATTAGWINPLLIAAKNEIKFYYLH